MNQPGRLVLVLFVFVNGLVLTNAILHEPVVQYDTWAHLHYVEALAQFHLPEFSDTRTFFSPPLPYVFPALLVSTGHFTFWTAAKLAQVLNILLSVGLTLALLKICEQMRPGSWGIKIATLSLLGVQTVYYKMFAFPRGEPWVAFLSVLSVYQLLEIWTQGRRTAGRVVRLGISLGLLALSRQWGFFVFPAIIAGAVLLVLRRPAAWLQILKPLAASLVLAALIGAPFYLSLLARYGTLTAFNRQPAARFSFSNEPADFYIGLGAKRLFTSPVRPAFPNQFWPIFYSDAWGDYWQYFSVCGVDARQHNKSIDWFVSGKSLQAAWLEEQPWLITNREGMEAYLGRVNAAGLFPSALYLCGLLGGFTALARVVLSAQTRAQTWARPKRSFVSHKMTDVPGDGIQDGARDLTLALAAMIVVFSLAGYAWFLIRYPSLGKGDTIKAGYLLHIFPFLALLAGDFLERLRGRSNLLYVGGLALLALVTIHNLPAMVTHYIPAEKMACWLGVELPERTMGAEGGVGSVSFSPDGTIRLSEVGDREQLGNPLARQTDSALTLTFNPNGKTLPSVRHAGNLWP